MNTLVVAGLLLLAFLVFESHLVRAISFGALGSLLVLRLRNTNQQKKGAKTLSGLGRSYYDACEVLQGASKVHFVVHLSSTASTLSAVFSEQKVKNAVKKLQQRHPLLQTKVELVDSQKCTVKSEFDIPVKIWTNAGAKDYLSFVQQDINDVYKLDEQKRMILAEVNVFIRRNEAEAAEAADLVIKAHHCICDGASMSQLSHELLALIAAEGSSQAADLPAPHPLPASEEFHPDARDFLDLLYPKLQQFLITAKLLFAHYFQRHACVALHPPSVKRSPPTKMTNSDYSRVLEFFSITGSEYQNLIKRCKAEGATVHSALVAALLMAAQEEAKRQGQEPDKQTKTYPMAARIAMDVRKILPADMPCSVLGMYVASFSVDEALPADLKEEDKPKKLWAMAKSLRAQITQQCSNKEDVLQSLIIREVLASTITNQILTNTLSMNCVVNSSNLGDQSHVVKQEYTDGAKVKLQVHGTKFWSAVQTWKSLSVFTVSNHGTMNVTGSFPFPPFQDETFCTRFAEASHKYLQMMTRA